MDAADCSRIFGARGEIGIPPSFCAGRGGSCAPLGGRRESINACKQNAAPLPFAHEKGFASDFCAAFAIFARGENVPDRVLPESEYPYWGGYKKTNFEDVKPAEWIAEDSVKDGWDWSLPPRVKPDPNSYVTLYRTGMNGMGKIAKIKPVNFPSIPVVGFWLNWKDIEKPRASTTSSPSKT